MNGTKKNNQDCQGVVMCGHISQHHIASNIVLNRSPSFLGIDFDQRPSIGKSQILHVSFLGDSFRSVCHLPHFFGQVGAMLTSRSTHAIQDMKRPLKSDLERSEILGEFQSNLSFVA